MSATVTYKGATLTTATNQTRVLETEGTYLEDDITITDVSTIPSGTKNISITANGTTTEDVTSYASASITANVPNSYTASDEGKVVSSGALVAQTAHADVTPTTSYQTIDTTTNNSIKVKGDANLVAGNIKKDVEIFGTTGSYEGSGGGYTIDEIMSGAEPSGSITIAGPTIRRNALSYSTVITSITIANTVTNIGNGAFENSSLQYLYNNSTQGSAYMVRNCSLLKEVHCPYWPSSVGFGGYGAQGLSSIELVDFGLCSTISLQSLPSCPLHTLIVRKTGSCANLPANTLNNSTAFRSGGTGGTVYVPNDLIASYKTASNWSTYYNYGTMEFKAIEGSIYEL